MPIVLAVTPQLQGHTNTILPLMAKIFNISDILKLERFHTHTHNAHGELIKKETLHSNVIKRVIFPGYQMSIYNKPQTNLIFFSLAHPGSIS